MFVGESPSRHDPRLAVTFLLIFADFSPFFLSARVSRVPVRRGVRVREYLPREHDVASEIVKLRLSSGSSSTLSLRKNIFVRSVIFHPCF